MFKRLLTLSTHKIYALPIIVLMPHSRCNCRCVMCDIWKANHDKKEISVTDLEKHIQGFLKVGVREIVFSGGEALMHSNLWKFCSLIKQHRIKITLLSTGLLLQRFAKEIIENIDEVIISLDGSKEVHDKIRNIPDGFTKITEGVNQLKALKKDYRITARCVLQRYNYFDFPNLVEAARKLQLNQISVLAADVSSTAFNRPEQWSRQRISEVALNREETLVFEEIIEKSFTEFKHLYTTKFIAENPARMRKIVQYYKAINSMGSYPEVNCNAPWVSAVIESDGSVLPCFFHKAYGNIYENDFLEIVNSKQAVDFRKNLDMSHDPVCRKCVCSLKLGVTQMN